MRYLTVVAALLLWAVATPADAESGWLLLYPPTDRPPGSGAWTFDDSAALSLWDRAPDNIYVTERRCQMSRLNVIAITEKASKGRANRYVDLIRASRCVSTDDPGLGTIRYTPGRPIVATVTLNDLVQVRLVLDTGADMSAVKPDKLAIAGVDLARPAKRGTIHVPGGRTFDASYYGVTFAAGGHRVLLPGVAAISASGDDSDGLLGRDFLDWSAPQLT